MKRPRSTCKASGAARSSGVLYRSAMLACGPDGRARAVDGEDGRSFDFVASTEAPVMTWGGPEVLRMSGVRLRRYKRNPVILDSHRATSIRSILGTGEARVEGRRLIVRVTFDDTPEGEAARLRVKSGSLRAVSVGYRVDQKKTLVLGEGESDGQGEGKVTGPAVVVRSWELLEISMVPVPADEDALRRTFYAPLIGGRSRLPANGAGIDLDASELEMEADPVVERAACEARIAGLRADESAATAAAIRDMAPAYLRDVAEDAILRGLDMDAARELLLAARAERPRPGVVETFDGADWPTGSPLGERGEGLPEWLTDEALASFFRNMPS